MPDVDIPGIDRPEVGVGPPVPIGIPPLGPVSSASAAVHGSQTAAARALQEALARLDQKRDRYLELFAAGVIQDRKELDRHLERVALEQGTLQIPWTPGRLYRGGTARGAPALGAQPVAQNELLRPVAHFESTPIQNELLYIESLLKTTKQETLNVRAGINFVDGGEKVTLHPQGRMPRDLLNESLDAQVSELVEELHDRGSERRHKQLLSVCEQHGLSYLPSQALQATRQRLAKERKQGVLEKPGAYYQSILISLLEGHQIFVPTAGEDDAGEVRRLVRQSLGLGLP